MYDKQVTPKSRRQVNSENQSQSLQIQELLGSYTVKNTQMVILMSIKVKCGPERELEKLELQF